MLLPRGAGRGIEAGPVHRGLGRHLELAQRLDRRLHGVDGRHPVEGLVDVWQGGHELGHRRLAVDETALATHFHDARSVIREVAWQSHDELIFGVQSG